MSAVSKVTRIGRAVRCLLTALLVWAPLPAAAQRGKTKAPVNGVSAVGDIGAVASGLGPSGAPSVLIMGSQQLLGSNPLSPIAAAIPVVVQGTPTPLLSLPISVLPGEGRLPAQASAVSLRPPTDGKPAVTALSGLLRHGAESGQVAKTKGGADAKNGAALNFMQSAALESPLSGNGDVSANADGQAALLAKPGQRLPRTSQRRGLIDDAAASLTKGAVGAPAKRTITLDNGMIVSLDSQPDKFTATVVVAYDVGGRDEPEGESGYTHFVEHLMFQGTTRIKNWFRMVGTMGAQTGAWTHRDHTIYSQTLPYNMLKTALSLEAERMVNLDVTPEKVEREKRVILEEKAGRDSSPYVMGLDTLNQLLFIKKRNHSNVIGSETDIRGATAAKLKRYLATYYTPDRAHVVIKGKLDLDETEAWVRQYFGSIPARKSDVVKADLSETGLKKEARAEILDGAAANPAVLFGWLAPKYKTADYYAAGVLTLLLTQRLQQKLIVGERSALAAALAVPYLEREPGAMTGSITLGSGLTSDAALAALDEEIARVARGEINATELAAMLITQVAWGRQVLDAADSLASARGLAAADLEADIQKWGSVSAADLRRVAQTFFGKNQRAVVTVKPDARKVAAAVALQHEHGPRVDETPTAVEQALLLSLARTQWPEFHYMAPTEFTLDNGLKVIVQPDSRVPTVHAKLAFRLGDTAADPGMRAQVPFAAQLLRVKTALKDELAMGRVLQSIRATLQVNQAWDHMVFNGNAGSADAEILLRLMAEIVTRPAGWTDAELAPYKAWWKESMKAGAADAGAATLQRAVSDLLGDHPSAQGLTPEAIDALSAAEFVKLVAGHFAANNAVLVIAGAVDPARMKEVLTPLFSAWKSSVKTAAVGPVNDVKPQNTISLLDRPGAEQSMIRLSAIAVDAGAQNSADHFPIIVADSVLGGGLASRLTSTLRQSLGLAYNTFSSVVTDPTFAMLTLGLYTRTGRTAQALNALLEQVRRLRQDPVGEIELGAAKNALISSFIIGLDSIGNIADNLLGLTLFNNQPLRDFGLYPKRVAAVTSKDVQQSAAKLLDPKRLAITVAGDAAAVKGDLSKVRPVVERTSEGARKERPSF